MGAMGGRSGGRLLVLCASAVCLWEQAAAAGGAIFTGRIDAFCVSKMMVKMVFFAMVCSAPPSPAPGPVPPARVAPPLGCACCRGYVGHSSCVCWVCVCVCVCVCLCVVVRARAVLGVPDWAARNEGAEPCSRRPDRLPLAQAVSVAAPLTALRLVRCVLSWRKIPHTLRC